MPADYYSDAPPAADAPPAEDSTDQEGDYKSGETTIVPKTVFTREVKPGDKEMFRVVSVHDDNVEVQCVGDSQDEASEGPTEPPESTPDGDEPYS